LGEGDIAYLSRHGIQVLGRVVRARSNPSVTVSKNIRTYLSNLMTRQPVSSIRSAYSPEHGFYLLLLPDADRVIVMDTRYLFEDDDGSTVAPMLEWSYTTMPTSVCVRQNGDLLFGFDGQVGEYESNLHDDAQYTVLYSSPWLDFQDQRITNALKILKEIPTIVQLSSSASIAWRWEFDFSGEIFSETTSHTLPGLSEWGEAEYNIGEYSGGLI